MSVIDILTVFNADNFPSNSGDFARPDGSNSYKYSNNHYVRMLSFSNKVSNNGQWNLEISEAQNDVINWVDTTESQGDTGSDLIIYDFKISDEKKWNEYLAPLESSEFHSSRFYISGGFQTSNPTFQYVSGPNNMLSTKVIKRPTNGDVTLKYYLKVVKLSVGPDARTQVIGTYGIDPTITIKQG